MRMHNIMGLAYIWICGQIIGNAITYGFMDSEVEETIKEMTTFTVFGWQGIGVPILGIGFSRHLPELITFEYGWLTGGWAFIQLFMSVITLAIIWVLIQTFVPPLISAFSGLVSRIIR